MITILQNEKNNIIYACDCGVKGKCMVKPSDTNDTADIRIIQCPVCLEVEKVVYGSDKEADLSWSVIISNNIIEYSLKKEDKE
jgi:hypothetical protein